MRPAWTSSLHNCTHFRASTKKEVRTFGEIIRMQLTGFRFAFREWLCQ